jgi:plastocyanin
MRKTLMASIAVLALVDAACSSNSSPGTTDTGAPATSGASTASACTDATATDLSKDDPFTVTIQGFAFHPDCFVAKSAASFTVTNEDTVTHTFTVDGTPVDVLVDGGQTVNEKSPGLAPGTYPFHCKIHPTITGTLIVV